jgi:hypothetical protein
VDFEQVETGGFEPDEPREERARRERDPASTLTSSMVVYIAINLVFGLPLAAAPEWYFDVIGMSPAVADDLGGLRWLGASLLAWGVSGVVVLLRPGGRSTFVTAGALQLSAAAVALLYSWSVGEYEWSTWFHVFTTLVVLGGAVYLSFARLAGRKVLKGV